MGVRATISDWMETVREYDWKSKRNWIASGVAGFLFPVGWWIAIDVAVSFPAEAQFKHAYHAVGVLSTLSLLIVNVVSNAQISADNVTTGGLLGYRGARLFLFLGFVLGIACLIASVWVLFADFVADTKKHVWPGVGLLLQNALIFLASMILKFGRKEEDPFWR